MKGFGDIVGISDRIEGTIENWRTKWGDILKGWFTAIVAFGLEAFFDILSKAAAPKLKPLIDKLEATGKVPPELKPILDEIKEPTGEVGAMLSQSAGGALVGGAIGKIIDASMLPISYAYNKATQNVMLTLDQYLASWLRGKITPEYLKEAMYATGLPDSDHDLLKDLAKIRLDPMSWVTAFRRKYKDFDKIENDLKDIGWTKERIEALKFFTLYYPSPAELIHWQAKEVFEPDMIAKYGLMAEADRIERDAFYKAGMSDEQIDNHWMAHWIHPAFREMTNMLHRGEITDADLYEWYRVVEIPPHWRDKLTAISWDLPNRIELRMMARYGLVDKPFLVEQLKLVGLREDFRSIAADMMLAMGIRTDLSTRYSKGWITPDVVKQELKDSGLSPQVQERMYQWIVKNTGTERVAAERDLTLTDIYKAIKKGLLGYTQGLELIEDMGYDEFEARLKLEVNVGALEGSPETYLEIKRLTQLYKQSQGLEAKIPSTELIQAEKNVIETKRLLDSPSEEEARAYSHETRAKNYEAAKLTFHALNKKERGED